MNAPITASMLYDLVSCPHRDPDNLIRNQALGDVPADVEKLR